MSHPFLERLTRKRPFLLDTGLSTELERRGATLDPRLWSSRLLLDAPELIVSVHLDNLSAGAQVITTATYQASFEGFAEVLGLSRNASRDLMARSVELARQAVRLHLERTPVSLPPAIAGGRDTGVLSRWRRTACLASSTDRAMRSRDALRERPKTSANPSKLA